MCLVPDVYPSDAAARIRQLEKDVAELKALLQARPGQTQASKGWLLTDMSIPTVSAGTCHIGCNNSDFFAQTAAGTKRMFLQAAAVANQANFLSGQIAGAPTMTQYNNLQTDAVLTRAKIFEMQTSLRNSGQMAT
jgi:hypothetical protein